MCFLPLLEMAALPGSDWTWWVLWSCLGKIYLLRGRQGQGRSRSRASWRLTVATRGRPHPRVLSLETLPTQLQVISSVVGTVPEECGQAIAKRCDNLALIIHLIFTVKWEWNVTFAHCKMRACSTGCSTLLGHWLEHPYQEGGVFLLHWLRIH